MALHKNLPEAELHEPKGVSLAAQGTTYVSTGAGTGTWKKPGINEIDRTGFRGINTYVQPFYHNNITAVKSAYINILVPGKIATISGVIDAATTADVTLTFLKNGTDALTTVIVASGSVEGSRFSFNLPALPTVAAGDFIKIQSSGGGTGTVVLSGLVLINHTFT